jgi:hypothetical protein
MKMIGPPSAQLDTGGVNLTRIAPRGNERASAVGTWTRASDGGPRGCSSGAQQLTTLVTTTDTP